MKKIFTLLLVMSALVVNAQSIKLFYNSQILNNNDTIQELLVNDENEINTFVGYQNTTSNLIEFQVRKEIIIFNSETTDLLFCLGNCYDGNQSQPIILDANGNIPSDDMYAFHAIYMGAKDAALVKFTFVNLEDESDKVSFYIHYSDGTGLRENEVQTSLRAYPNPAVSTVNIDYVAPNNHSYLVIKNLAGKEVYRTPVSYSGKKQLDVSAFYSGVYFYGLESDGKMLYTKKLLIK
jgi:hypothetical protein